MAQIKTTQLTGHALDWAVAKCEGKPVVFSRGAVRFPPAQFSDEEVYSPSTDWSVGGPIIDQLAGFQFKDWIESRKDSRCQADIHNYEGDWIAFGPDPLTAAMRCYVASKLGDTVDIPDELLTNERSAT